MESNVRNNKQLRIVLLAHKYSRARVSSKAQECMLNSDFLLKNKNHLLFDILYFNMTTDAQRYDQEKLYAVLMNTGITLIIIPLLYAIMMAIGAFNGQDPNVRTRQTILILFVFVLGLIILSVSVSFILKATKEHFGSSCYRTNCSAFSGASLNRSCNCEYNAPKCNTFGTGYVTFDNKCVKGFASRKRCGNNEYSAGKCLFAPS